MVTVKNIIVLVAVMCGAFVYSGAQWRIMEIPDPYSRYVYVRGMVSVPNGGVIVLTEHVYQCGTISGFKYDCSSAQIHRTYSDGTVQHLATFRFGDNEYEPGTSFGGYSVLGDTIVFKLLNLSDVCCEKQIGVLNTTTDSVFLSEAYRRVHWICSSRKAVVSNLYGEIGKLLDIYTGETQDVPVSSDVINGFGPVVARTMPDTNIIVERMCTDERVDLGNPRGSMFEVGPTGTVYRLDRADAPRFATTGISWSNDMGVTFSNVVRYGDIKKFYQAPDGGHVILTEHTTNPKNRVSFADRYGNLRFGYVIVPDSLRVDAIAGTDRGNISIGVNWYDSTYKAHLGVAFLDPSVAVTQEEVITPMQGTWTAYTVLGQYVASGEGAFEVAFLAPGMYIVVELGKSRLVMKHS